MIALIFHTAKELKIAPHGSIIANSSLANAILPDDWNSARVTPPLCLIYVLRYLGNEKNFLNSFVCYYGLKNKNWGVGCFGDFLPGVGLIIVPTEKSLFTFFFLPCQ